MATINDVAKKAGVSITTVSHVINKTRYVSKELREKVNRAIIEVGYTPNQLARSLRSGVSTTLGLMIPDNSNPYFAEIAKTIEAIGFEFGYSVILCNSAGDLKKEKAYIETLLSHMIDGIIFIAVNSKLENLMKIKEQGIPFVLVDRNIPEFDGDVVLVNNEIGGYLATKHLIDLGHRKIACICGPSDVTPSADRVKGYARALKEAGLPFIDQYVVAGDFEYQSGEVAFEKLSKLNDRPTAIFVCNDMMAIGVLRRAKSMNINIPEDISVVGFDNIHFSSAVSPSLTTVSQPTQEISEQAVNILIKKIQKGGEARTGVRIVLNPELVVRESSISYPKNK